MSFIQENFDSSRGIAENLRALRSMWSGLKMTTVKASESEDEGENYQERIQNKLNSKGESVQVNK